MKGDDLPSQVRNENIVVRDFENEILFYDLKTSKAFCLNRTSAVVWRFCDGKTSVAEISGLVSNEFEGPVPEELVELTLNPLANEGLLEDETGFAGRHTGVKRRELIKKVGLGTLVALPVIASLVAPTSLMAQSNCVIPGSSPAGKPIGALATVAACGVVANSACTAFPGSMCCSGMATSTNCVSAPGGLFSTDCVCG